MIKYYLFFAFQCALPLFAQFTLQDSLVAHYPMNGNALDISGNGNHGTLINGVSLSTDRFGNPNSAYFFDGVDDYITISSFSSNFKPPLPISISCWVKIQSTAPHIIFNSDAGENVYDGVFLGINSQGFIGISYGDGGLIGPSWRRSKLSTTSIQAGNWYHIAVVVRSALDMDIYVNGKEDCGTYTGSGGPLAYSSNNPGNIGRADGNGGVAPWNYLHGDLDELRYYSRSLTKEEIRMLADINSGPDTICAGDSIQLDAGYGISYAWSGLGLSCTNCPTPFASPTTSTIYQVITQNTTGCFDTLSRLVVVDSCLTCDSLNLNAGFAQLINAQTVFFIDQSTGSTDSVVWDFGDGNVAAGPPGNSPTHQYTFSGIYQVCQTIYGSFGDSICTDSTCKLIDIEATCENLGLAASFSAFSTNFTVNFQDFSTGPIDSLQWAFDDGTDTTTLFGATFAHTYSTADTFTVCLIAYASLSDGTICSDTFCTPVITTIESACDTTAIVADFNLSVSGLTATFSDASFGQDVNAINWNLDGINWVPDTVGGNATFTYPSAGTYPVCIEAIDWYGDSLACRDTFCMNIDIRPIGIEEEIKESWHIYPNPFMEGFWIKPLHSQASYSVEVYNQLGQIILRNEEKRNVEMFVSDSHWSSGIYMVKIRTAYTSEWYKLYKIQQ